MLVHGSYGRQSDEIREDLKFFEILSDRIVRSFTAFYEGSCSVIILLPMHFSRSAFQVKYIVRRVVEAQKSGTPCFFVSIPTIKYYRVLNDTHTIAKAQTFDNGKLSPQISFQISTVVFLS